MREDNQETETPTENSVVVSTASRALESFIRVIGIFIIIIVLASGFQSYIMLQQRWALNRAATTIHDQSQRSKDAEQLFDSVRALLISGLSNNPNLTPEQQRILNDLKAQQVQRDAERAKQTSSTTTTRPKVEGGAQPPPTTSTVARTTTTTRQRQTTTTTTTLLPVPLPIPVPSPIPVPCSRLPMLLPCPSGTDHPRTLGLGAVNVQKVNP